MNKGFILLYYGAFKICFLVEVDTLWYTMSEKKNTQFFTCCSEKQYILKILWTNGEQYFKKLHHSSFWSQIPNPDCWKHQYQDYKIQIPLRTLTKWQMNKWWQENIAKKYVFCSFKVSSRDFLENVAQSMIHFWIGLSLRFIKAYLKRSLGGYYEYWILKTWFGKWLSKKKGP